MRHRHATCFFWVLELLVAANLFHFEPASAFEFSDNISAIQFTLPPGSMIHTVYTLLNSIKNVWALHAFCLCHQPKRRLYGLICSGGLRLPPSFHTDHVAAGGKLTQGRRLKNDPPRRGLLRNGGPHAGGGGNGGDPG